MAASQPPARSPKAHRLPGSRLWAPGTWGQPQLSLALPTTTSPRPLPPGPAGACPLSPWVLVVLDHPLKFAFLCCSLSR